MSLLPENIVVEGCADHTSIDLVIHPQRPQPHRMSSSLSCELNARAPFFSPAPAPIPSPSPLDVFGDIYDDDNDDGDDDGDDDEHHSINGSNAEHDFEELSDFEEEELERCDFIMSEPQISHYQTQQQESSHVSQSQSQSRDPTPSPVPGVAVPSQLLLQHSLLMKQLGVCREELRKTKEMMSSELRPSFISAFRLKIDPEKSWPSIIQSINELRVRFQSLAAKIHLIERTIDTLSTIYHYQPSLLESNLFTAERIPLRKKIALQGMSLIRSEAPRMHQRQDSSPCVIQPEGFGIQDDHLLQ